MTVGLLTNLVAMRSCGTNYLYKMVKQNLSAVHVPSITD